MPQYPLPAHTPILQSESDLRLADSFLRGNLLKLLLRLHARQPAELARLDQHAVFGNERQLRLFGLGAGWLYHAAHFNPVLLRKLEIALIVRGNAHNRARAIVGQDVIRHPDRHTLAVIWIDGKVARRHAVLFNRANVAGLASLLLLIDQLRDFCFQVGIIGGERSHQRMLRCKLHARRAENSIDARGKDANLLRAAFDGEINLRALAAANPVALHGAYFFRPAVELVEAVEQLLRVGGDAKEPLHQIAQLDNGVLMPPAAAIDDLLVGEHSGAFGAPV